MVRNSPATTPRWITSRVPIIAVSRNTSSSRPVKLVRKSIQRKVLSRVSIFSSAGSRSLFDLRYSSPTVPMHIITPPTVPNTTGRLR